MREWVKSQAKPKARCSPYQQQPCWVARVLKTVWRGHGDRCRAEWCSGGAVLTTALKHEASPPPATPSAPHNSSLQPGAYRLYTTALYNLGGTDFTQQLFTTWGIQTLHNSSLQPGGYRLDTTALYNLGGTDFTQQLFTTWGVQTLHNSSLQPGAYRLYTTLHNPWHSDFIQQLFTT